MAEGSAGSSKKVVLPAALFFLGLLVGAMLGWGAALHYHTLDGIWGWFFSSDFLPSVLGRPFEDDTEYAPGYSDHAFRKVRIGMSEEEVLSLLGPPLGKGPMRGSKQTWVWSRSPRDKSYRVRTVIFETGRVVKVVHSFYLD